MNFVFAVTLNIQIQVSLHKFSNAFCFCWRLAHSFPEGFHFIGGEDSDLLSISTKFPSKNI